ncbi:variable large family protein (plasmid) [Borrelia coriaceae]|nr:variable large family protein [Borrelia coriaceae]
MRLKSICATLFISLFLSCNNSGESAEAEKRLTDVLMDVSRSAENAFYSFISLISDTLGLKVTKDTAKNEVGNYYKKLAEGIDQAIKELLLIASKTVQSDNQSGKEENLSNLNKAIEKAKQMFEKLKGCIASLESIGDNSKVGEVGSTSQQGEAANESALRKAYDALKGIVDIAMETGVKELKKSNLVLDQRSIGGSGNPENGAKVLAVGAAGADSGPGAAAIVAAVIGEEILESIVKSEGKAVTISVAATADTTPLEFAMGGTNTNLNKTVAKAADVSGGIALRSLVKGGKLASNTSNEDKVTVQAVGIDAVNKLLGALEDIIRKTINKILEKVKTEVDEVRNPKSAIQQ